MSDDSSGLNFGPRLAMYQSGLLAVDLVEVVRAAEADQIQAVVENIARHELQTGVTLVLAWFLAQSPVDPVAALRRMEQQWAAEDAVEDEAERILIAELRRVLGDG